MEKEKKKEAQKPLTRYQAHAVKIDKEARETIATREIIRRQARALLMMELLGEVHRQLLIIPSKYGPFEKTVLYSHKSHLAI